MFLLECPSKLPILPKLNWFVKPQKKYLVKYCFQEKGKKRTYGTETHTLSLVPTKLFGAF